MEKIITEVGEAFEISLRGNPSTGYRWEPQFDSTLLSLIDRRYQSAQRKTGSAGLEILNFRALKAGKTEIAVILKRQWEKDIAKKEIFEILIK